ncbi:RNA polymerase sigma factor [uncultured Aquitalea sp.]|uniref:RNA polymerase sigma factor n=1 Tax=uncultured Aquitalea sp. TaxID=540272 RepID=UPI0025E3A888|nr:RNA polymerase sigma factor [uncultured Aquitalea sp.]
MATTNSSSTMSRADRDIADTVTREQGRLRQFIRKRIGDVAEAEDILQDVFYEFVQAYRLPSPIEQATAWLYQVARNRIVDRFRKKRETPLAELGPSEDDDDLWLNLALPADDNDPAALYARQVALTELQAALDALPASQREVFVAHELEGRSFRELAEDAGLPINTLLSRKRYAVLSLRERLQTLYEDMDL